MASSNGPHDVYKWLSVVDDLQNPRAWFMLCRSWTCPNQQEADMKFGLFQSVQLLEPGAQAKYYQEALEQVRWAEQLGFHSVWFTEHHFSRHGIVPASMTVLAYLAGLTKSIRLATAVAVLPFHNPIQLAEEAATVDLLSDGRLDLGVGAAINGVSSTSSTFPWTRPPAAEEADGRDDQGLDGDRALRPSWGILELQ